MQIKSKPVMGNNENTTNNTNHSPSKPQIELFNNYNQLVNDSTNINKPDNHSMNTKNKNTTYDVAKTRSWIGTDIYM
jgi:BRCT domain type II-containing protein